MYPLDFSNLLRSPQDQSTLERLLTQFQTPPQQSTLHDTSIIQERVLAKQRQRCERFKQAVEIMLRKVRENKKEGERTAGVNATSELGLSEDVVEVLRQQFSMLKGRGIKRGSISSQEAQDWKLLIDSLV